MGCVASNGALALSGSLEEVDAEGEPAPNCSKFDFNAPNKFVLMAAIVALVFALFPFVWVALEGGEEADPLSPRC